METFSACITSEAPPRKDAIAVARSRSVLSPTIEMLRLRRHRCAWAGEITRSTQFVGVNVRLEKSHVPSEGWRLKLQ